MICTRRDALALLLGLCIGYCLWHDGMWLDTMAAILILACVPWHKLADYFQDVTIWMADAFKERRVGKEAKKLRQEIVEGAKERR